MPQTYSTPLVVIVDRNDADRAATREMLTNSGRVHLAGAVREASELARYMSAEPDIVLLDVGVDPLAVPAIIRQVQRQPGARRRSHNRVQPQGRRRLHYHRQ